jgi:hypothetical protein
MLDYTMGIILIIAPWLFQFGRGGAETWIFIILGAAVIFYSLLTNYELGAVRILSMPTHLWLDGISGALLALSPWLFGFADLVYLPHLIFGLLEIGAAVMTETTPGTSYTRKPIA